VAGQYHGKETEMSNEPTLSELIKASLAVLSQEKTFPADIQYAKSLLSEALAQIEKKAEAQ
jgi:hypothetical protein